MDKYISADKFRAMMYHRTFEEDNGLQRWDSGCWIRYKMFENALKQIEPADVQEVRNGRWLYLHLEPDDITGHTKGECSICGKLRIVDNYCPNCGSRMDLEGDTE